MNLSDRFRQGVKWGGGVALALILIPPLVADKFSSWENGRKLIADSPATIKLCGGKPDVEFSRWFYSYRFSGGIESARYSGKIIGSNCNRSFRVSLKAKDDVWEIDTLEFLK